MNLRPARENDLAAVGDLTVAAYAEFMVGAEHDAYREQLRDARPRFAESELWVADEAGELLGAVARCPAGSPWREIAGDDEGEFRMLAVAPVGRGRGIGTALVRRCEHLFAEEGVHRMVLSTLPSMTDAHRLYEHLGYARDTDRDWSPAPGVSLWSYVRG